MCNKRISNLVTELAWNLDVLEGQLVSSRDLVESKRENVSASPLASLAALSYPDTSKNPEADGWLFEAVSSNALELSQTYPRYS